MAVSPWLDDLQDDPDNYLIIGPPAAAADNPNEHYRFDGVGVDDWINFVITSGPGRAGDYRAQAVLDGAEISGAVTCCVQHARVGQIGAQLWNASGTDPDDRDPAICALVPESGLALDPSPQTVETTYAAGWSDDDIWMVGGGAGCIVNGPSYFLYYLPVRDHMPPRGALDYTPQPEDYGYPPFSEGTEIEWEDPYAELIGLQIADGDPVDTAPFPNQWALNDGAGPTYGSGSGWRTGVIPIGGGMDWLYDNGPIAWYDIADAAIWADQSWHADYEDKASGTASGADGVAIAQPHESSEDFPVRSRFARPALKFILRASRFRFRFPGPNPVTRQYPRDDGRGISSAPRLHPPTKAGRLAGGYM